MFNNIYKSLFWITIIFFSILIVSKSMSFELWPQVYYFRGAWEGVNVLTIDPMAEPHLIRYMLVWPIFTISDYLTVDSDFIFSLCCIFIIYFLSMNIASIATFTFFDKEKCCDVAILISLTSILILSSFMNGRILFAMLGFSLIVLSIIRYELDTLSSRKMFFYIFSGYFLCSVSSGTFLVAIFFTLSWFLIGIKRKRTLEMYLSYLILIALISPLIYVSLINNIDFYGGGFYGLINMLHHGAGIVFYRVGEFMFYPLIIMCILAIILALWLLHVLPNLRVILLAIYASILGGAFGFSSFAVGLPIIISLFLFCTLNMSGFFCTCFKRIRFNLAGVNDDKNN